MNSHADKQITVFSKEGKLYQVEYSFNAIKNSGYSSVGVRGKDCVVVLTQKKLPDKSIVPSSMTHIFKVSESIGVLFTGYLPDAKNILLKMRQNTLEFLDKYGYHMPINVLAQKMSEECQYYTQRAFMRPLCAISFLFSIDDEKGPQLIKIDPAGFFMGYRACSSGEKEEQLNNHLEKQFKERIGKEGFSQDEAVAVGIKALQSVRFLLYRL